MSKNLPRPLLAGAILWVASLQYYLVQAVVAADWPRGNGYSWAQNTISDLANTHCGQYGSRLVCSPLHPVMNTSFLVLGTTMIGGAYLLLATLAHSRLSKLGFVLMAWSGVGTVIVGLYPENATSSLHIAGAAFSFIFGNVAMILIGAGLAHLPKPLRIYMIASGAVGLLALALFMTQTYLGLGIGGMERFTAYPQSIWMIVFGIYLLVSKTKDSSMKLFCYR